MRLRVRVRVSTAHRLLAMLGSTEGQVWAAGPVRLSAAAAERA